MSDALSQWFLIPKSPIYFEDVPPKKTSIDRSGMFHGSYHCPIIFPWIFPLFLGNPIIFPWIFPQFSYDFPPLLILQAAHLPLGLFGLFASANRWSHCDPRGRSHVSTATAGCRHRERYVLRSKKRGEKMGSNGIIDVSIIYIYVYNIYIYNYTGKMG